MSTARITNPAIDENDFEVEEKTLDLSTTKPEQVTCDKLPPVTMFAGYPSLLSYGNYIASMPRMQLPFMMPPLNPAMLALYAKTLHVPSFPVLPHLDVNPPPRPPKAPSAKQKAQNPIVKAILNDTAPSKQPINHNACAVCGETFRRTGDLVHHMRRERCRLSASQADPHKMRNK